MDSLLKDVTSKSLGMSSVLKNVENSPHIFSPIPARTGLASLTPQKDIESLSDTRKTKLEASNLGIKSKRLRKLTDQLPDIGGVEDILKLQEEINDSQSKIKVLEESVAQLQQQLQDKDRDIETLVAEKEQLKEQIKDQTRAKDMFLLELTNKTQQSVAMENEKSVIALSLEAEKKKVSELVQDLQQQQNECVAHQKRLELLEATLKENASQLLIQQQQHKQLITEIDQLKLGKVEVTEKFTSYMQTAQREQQQLTEERVSHLQQQKNLEEQLGTMKKEYFFSVALCIKLNLSLHKETNNIDIQSLYDLILVESIPVDMWPRWILNQLDKKHR